MRVLRKMPARHRRRIQLIAEDDLEIDTRIARVTNSASPDHGARVATEDDEAEALAMIDQARRLRKPK